MPIDGPLMAIDGPHGTAMAIDELRWDLSTGKGTETARTFIYVELSQMAQTLQVLSFSEQSVSNLIIRGYPKLTQMGSLDTRKTFELFEHLNNFIR